MKSKDIGISEFTFGFAFLYEQTKMNKEDLTAVPILPSTRQEKDEAWDARLPRKGADYYYQFKISDYLYGRNAKFFRNGKYSSPYFRFRLYRDRNDVYTQHRTLKQFSINHPRTYYVAPQFTSESELRTAFIDEEVYKFSRLIPVRRCRDIRDDDSRAHCITYQRGVRKWICHSKTYECEESYFGEELPELYKKEDQEDFWQDINERYVRNLYKKICLDIMKIYKPDKVDHNLDPIIFPKRIPIDSSPQRLLVETSKLLAAFFGVSLVLAGEPRK